LCGIIASILIWKGGQKTKRTKAVEETLRAALEAEQQTGVPAAVVAVNQYRTQSMADFDDNVASTSLLDHRSSSR
jgi:predicted metal-dependent phosphotriesterase family hydrolase